MFVPCVVFISQNLSVCLHISQFVRPRAHRAFTAVLQELKPAITNFVCNRYDCVEVIRFEAVKSEPEKPSVADCRSQSGKPSNSFTLALARFKAVIHALYAHAGPWLYETSQRLVVVDLQFIDLSAGMNKPNMHVLPSLMV